MMDLKRARDRGNRPMDKALAIAWACILIVLVLFAYLPWS
ncbi:hypothetical protein ABIF69_010890 [Bradyrhizobium japonicum]